MESHLQHHDHNRHLYLFVIQVDFSFIANAIVIVIFNDKGNFTGTHIVQVDVIVASYSQGQIN